MKLKLLIVRLLLLMVVLPFTILSNAQKFTPLDNGSTIKFTIKNFGINASGTFKGLKGSIDFNPNSLSTSSFAVTVDAATIDTHIGARDKHLKKEEYFDVDKFPVLSFTSTKIMAGNTNGTFIMVGKLTIKGISKEINFPFVAHAQSKGYQFNGDFQLNRRDFNVGGKSMVLSDNLNVQLAVFAEKK